MTLYLVTSSICGSGLQAVITAAMEIQSGYASCVLAGGMENMDKAPYILSNGRYGARMGDTTLYGTKRRLHWEALRSNYR